MGRLGLLVVAGLAIAIGVYSKMMNSNAGMVAKTNTSYYTRLAAKNANNAAIQIGLQQLSDANYWRTGYSNLSIAGSAVMLRLKDTVISGDSAVKFTAKCAYYPDSLVNMVDSITTTVLVQVGTRPKFVKGAWTAAGNLNNTISDMYIDGRDHDTGIVSNGPPTTYQLIPNSGIYGVATSRLTFVNTQHASIGGTDHTTGVDYAPTYPESPKVIQTNAFPEGYPQTPDGVFGWAEGTLKAVAKSGTSGSRYLTTQKQMDSLCSNKRPLQGVTYVDVDTTAVEWDKKNIPDNSGGIFVFHNPKNTAYWKDISGVTTNPVQTFRGIMIFDKMFHFHMNCLGAMVLLNPATDTTDNCAGNQDKTVAYSGKLVQRLTKSITPKVAGGWRNKLTILSWVE